MRKFLLSILILTFVAFSINAQITNGGFESWTGANPVGWGGSKTHTTGLTIAKATTDAHGGTNACKLTNTTTSHKRFTSVATSVTNGTEYTISFWIKGATGQVRTGMYTGNPATMTTTSGYITYNAYVSATATWSQITQTLVADYTTSSAEFIISVGSSADVVIDDVEVTGGTTSTEANIESFTIPEQFANATIDTTARTVTMEVISGTGLTALTPTISLSSGATISPASGVQQNFTNPVTYTVTAQNGTTIKTWTATVTVSSTQSSAAEITGLSIPGQVSTPIINSNNATVSVIVSIGTPLTSLVPTITLSAAATVSPVSGIAQDFTNPVVYTVTAQNGTTTKNWTVTVTELQTTPIYEIQYTADPSGDSPLKDQTVTTSGIVSAVVPTKGYYLQDGDGAWNGIYVFDGTNTPAISDNVTITGKVVEYNGITEFSPVTSYTKNSTGNLISPTVISTGDAATKESYEGCFVQVKYANCESANNNGTWKVNDGSGLLLVYKGIYDYTGAVAGTLYDVTGVMTYFSLATPPIYELLPRQASDISVAIFNTEANIATFSFAEQTGVATIDTTAKTVNIEVFTGTNRSSLTPTITLSAGATISPLSNVAQDFMAAKTYTVTAQNTAFTKTWTVYVTVATNTQSSQAEILSFSFPSDKQAGASVINSVAGTITINVFPDIDRDSLTPTITNSVFSSISPASGVVQDFTNPITYTVTAQNTTPKTWTVTVTNQTLTPIYDIQFTTTANGESPKKNQIVTTSGVVTGIDQIKNYYFIQDSAKAWNGLYIYYALNTVSIGENITLTGKVDEFKPSGFSNSLTQLRDISSFKSNSTLNNITSVIVTATQANSEAYEGVLVTIDNAQCTRLPDNFNTWSLNDGTDSCTVDDVIFATSPILNRYYKVTGIATYYYGYKIYPRRDADLTWSSGINNLNVKDDKLIYPNPTSNKINIDIKVDVQSINLYNILGAKVMTVSPENSGIIELDLSSLEKGIYMLNIQYTEKYSETVKIVKQ